MHIPTTFDAAFSGSPDVGNVLSFVSDLGTNEQIELLSAIQFRLLQKGIAFRKLNDANTAVLGTG
jgi:hypothetical protein